MEPKKGPDLLPQTPPSHKCLGGIPLHEEELQKHLYTPPPAPLLNCTLQRQKTMCEDSERGGGGGVKRRSREVGDGDGVPVGVSESGGK